MQSSTSAYAKLPSIQEIDKYLEQQGKPSGKVVRLQIQQILKEFRKDLVWLQDSKINRESILALLLQKLDQQNVELQPVINATGTIVHTNLGRSIFSSELFQSIEELSTTYLNLEFSLESGKRGERQESVLEHLKTLTCAEAAIVVNNNAAAILLALSALSKGKEIIVSRGELIEIGGSFRVPDIIELSQGKLVEVGTTNRTYLRDYENAITENTAILLKVHTSNYKVIGFTHEVETKELAQLAQEKNLLVVEDMGSGVLTLSTSTVLEGESTVLQKIKSGADLVTFSGDKLIGGPQAGIIVGKRKWVDQVKKHPFYRAMRCGKVTVSLLEKTLQCYLEKKETEKIPTQKMLLESANQVKIRAEQILLQTQNRENYSLSECYSTPGGGSSPGVEIPSWGIEIQLADLSADDILRKLRQNVPPIIARVQKHKALLDCRTILENQCSTIVEALQKLPLNTLCSNKSFST